MSIMLNRKLVDSDNARTMYKIVAFWPAKDAAPYVTYEPTIDELINRVIELAKSGKYMSVSGGTPDSLEIIRMFGQLKGLP